MVSGGLIIDASRYYNDNGLALEGSTRALFLPSLKVDHVMLLDETETGKNG